MGRGVCSPANGEDIKFEPVGCITIGKSAWIRKGSFSLVAENTGVAVYPINKEQARLARQSPVRAGNNPDFSAIK
jgi:hypothetical protein